MHKLPFPYVTIMTNQSGKVRNITSVSEAAENLVMDWPVRDGPMLLAAKQACLDAMEGKILCSAARQAFIDAAKEADIYIGQQKI